MRPRTTLVFISTQENCHFSRQSRRTGNKVFFFFFPSTVPREATIKALLSVGTRKKSGGWKENLLGNKVLKSDLWRLQPPPTPPSCLEWVIPGRNCQSKSLPRPFKWPHKRGLILLIIFTWPSSTFQSRMDYSRWEKTLDFVCAFNDCRDNVQIFDVVPFLKHSWIKPSIEVVWCLLSCEMPSLLWSGLVHRKSTSWPWMPWFLL